MALQAPKPLKGILKKSTTTPTASSLTTNNAQDLGLSNRRDPRAAAIHHATLLQSRKDAEAQIFTNTLSLLDLPQYPNHPASAPHHSDIAVFTSLVRIFQPSDYDDLITERNITHDVVPQGRCGYALCPNARRRFRNAGAFKMINKGRKDFDIVETAELEKWCSVECTRRALWVKVQLSETAAWERVGLPELAIELYPERKLEGSQERGMLIGQTEELASDMSRLQLEQDDRMGGADGDLAVDMAKLQLEQDRKEAQDKAALATERGDDANNQYTRSVDVSVREKKVMTQPEAPSLGGASDTIEGFKSRFNRDRQDDESDEDMDDDWC